MGRPLRLGFVPLVDAAPLVAAFELGMFEEENLHVVLERQIGWGNVRDKLTFGQLDAAHALLGMPLFSVLGRDWFAEPLVAVMSLGSGLNAITLDRRLTEAGVRGASSLKEYLQSRRRREPLMLAHVFGCSMHHYLLRRWLRAAGIDPDGDVRLQVFPPSQAPRHVANGYLGGFCAGEPWNTFAEQEQIGTIVQLTHDIVPNHPEKVLAVSRRWAEHYSNRLPLLIQALIRACAWCADPANTRELARLLSKQEYLGVPEELMIQSLALRPSLGPFDPASTFPSRTHYAWLIEEMVRWGHLQTSTSAVALADACARSEPWRRAVEQSGIKGPDTEYPPMALSSSERFTVVQPQDNRRVAGPTRDPPDSRRAAS